MNEERPEFASGYGVSDGESGMIPWIETREQLTTSRNYWIATADPNGSPHSSPVWGVWLGDRLYFGTDPESKKAANIAANPRAVVHLESGDDVVIVHCDVSPIADDAVVERVFLLYREKYAMPDDFEFSPVLCATPRHGFAWREAEFPNTATRYFQ